MRGGERNAMHFGLKGFFVDRKRRRGVFTPHGAGGGSWRLIRLMECSLSDGDEGFGLTCVRVIVNVMILEGIPVCSGVLGAFFGIPLWDYRN